jgi:hypothetical protein
MSNTTNVNIPQYLSYMQTQNTQPFNDLQQVYFPSLATTLEKTSQLEHTFMRIRNFFAVFNSTNINPLTLILLMRGYNLNTQASNLNMSGGSLGAFPQNLNGNSCHYNPSLYFNSNLNKDTYYQKSTVFPTQSLKDTIKAKVDGGDLSKLTKSSLSTSIENEGIYIERII